MTQPRLSNVCWIGIYDVFSKIFEEPASLNDGALL